MTEPSLTPKHGRFSPELFDAICDRIAAGESLRSITRDEGMPSQTAFFKWLQADSKLVEQYVRAREVQAEGVFEELFEIADDATNDWMEQNDGENAGWRLNGEHVQRSRLRIDTRKWALARMSPRKYGDKVTAEVSGPDGGPIETNDRDMARRIAHVFLSASLPEATKTPGSDE